MATDGKTYNPLLSPSTGIDGYRTEYLFAAECINRRIPCFLAACGAMSVDAVCQTKHGNLVTIDCKSSRHTPHNSRFPRLDIKNLSPDADILAALDLIYNTWSLIPTHNIHTKTAIPLGNAEFVQYTNRWDILEDFQV